MCREALHIETVTTTSNDQYICALTTTHAHKCTVGLDIKAADSLVRTTANRNIRQNVI